MLPMLSRAMTWPEATEREFGRLARLWSDGGEPTTGSAMYPVNVWEDDEHLFVEAELPGFRKEDIDITLEQGVLQIAASRTLEPRRGALLNERRFDRYQRAFTLPCAVDDTKVDARFEDGILHLTLPKRAEVRPRRIAVS